MPAFHFVPESRPGLRAPPQLLQGANGVAALTEEVAQLRVELAALRRELLPVPSLILTGREVVEQFKRLSSAT